MVAALSSDRPKYAAHGSTHALAGGRGRELVDRFLSLADQDFDAYAGFAAALKLPKDDDDQRAIRSAALASAARVASEIPMACVDACLELVQAADMLAGRSNVNASSDLGVASLLAEAAARGAAANVLVNLPSVGDEAFAAAMKDRVDRALADISTTARWVQEVVESGEARAPLPTSNP